MAFDRIKVANLHVPQEAGLYWARSEVSYQWYDLIVQVIGKPPMLRVSEVHSRGLKTKEPHAVEYFGPKIEEPDVPREEIG